MPAFLHDPFDGAAGELLDHVGSTGATWTRHPATTLLLGPTNSPVWKLTGSGRIYAHGAGYAASHAANYLASGIPSGADYDIAGRLYIASYLGDEYGGVTFRYGSTANSGYLLRYELGSKLWKLMTMDAGVEGSSLGSWSDDIGVGNGRDFRIEARTSGTRITVKFDGVSRITSNDTTYTAVGRIGLTYIGSNGGTPEHGMHLEYLAAGEAGFTVPAAPAYSVSGPPSGPPDFDSSEFTAAVVEGVDPGMLVATPHVTGIAGAFSPTTITLTNTIRTATFTFRPDDYGTATITFTNDGVVADPGGLEYEADYLPPSRLAYWESRLGDRVTGGPWPYLPDEGYYLAGPDHYDPAFCYYNVREYSDRRGLGLDCSEQIAAGVIRFQHRAVVEGGGVPPYHRYNSGIVRHYYETGDPECVVAQNILLGEDDSSPSSLAFVNGFMPVDTQREAAWNFIGCVERAWMGLPPNANEDLWCSIIIGHMQMWTEPYATRRYGAWCKPFMGSLSARGLMLYWERYRGSADAEKIANCALIPDLLVAFSDYLSTPTGATGGCRNPAGIDVGDGWMHGSINYVEPGPHDPLIEPTDLFTVTSVPDATHCQGSSGLRNLDDFYKGAQLRNFRAGVPVYGYAIYGYVGATRTFFVPGATGGQIQVGDTIDVIPRNYDADVLSTGNWPTPVPSIDHMIFPIHAWAYWYLRRVAGEFEASKPHRTRACAVFDACFHSWEPTYAQKEYNQSALFTTHGLTWLDRGDSEWPDATAVALLAPAAGASGPHSEPAVFRVRLDPDYGAKLDEPLEVTPVSSTGRGTFSPNPVILTSWRSFAPLIFTPDPLDDDTTVDISVTSALTDPAPVAFDVGEPVPTAVSAYYLTGPSSGSVGVASGDFFVTLGSGTVTGTITFTPTASAGTGSFTPTTIGLTDSTRTAAFIYTPTSAGARNITAPDDAGLTDPAAIAYTASEAPAPGMGTPLYPLHYLPSGGLLLRTKG